MISVYIYPSLNNLFRLSIAIVQFSSDIGWLISSIVIDFSMYVLPSSIRALEVKKQKVKSRNNVLKKLHLY